MLRRILCALVLGVILTSAGCHHRCFFRHRDCCCTPSCCTPCCGECGCGGPGFHEP
jgi:hypothetical protein